MGLVTRVPYTAGASVTASGQNSNENLIANEFNGNIENVNIKSSAAIAASKLSLASIAQTMAMSSAIFKFAKGADVASAAGTITLGDDGNYFDITGTAAITSITAKTAGTVVILQFDSTASLVDGSNLKLAGNFTGAAESHIMLSSDGTNWFEVSRQPAYTASVTNALSGSVIQVVNTQTGAVASGTTVMPWDDTIPQNTEGDQYMTLAITPNNSSNKLKIDIVFYYAASITDDVVVGLFQDSTAGALAAISDGTRGGANSNNCVSFRHFMSAGTTSSTTFKIRAGTSSAGTTTFNGASTARKLGGVAASSITITEIKA